MPFIRKINRDKLETKISQSRHVYSHCASNLIYHSTELFSLNHLYLPSRIVFMFLNIVPLLELNPQFDSDKESDLISFVECCKDYLALRPPTDSKVLVSLNSVSKGAAKD